VSLFGCLPHLGPWSGLDAAPQLLNPDRTVLVPALEIADFAIAGPRLARLTPTKGASSRNCCAARQPFRPAMKRASVSLASTPPRTSPCQNGDAPTTVAAG